MTESAGSESDAAAAAVGDVEGAPPRVIATPLPRTRSTVLHLACRSRRPSAVMLSCHGAAMTVMRYRRARVRAAGRASE